MRHRVNIQSFALLVCALVFAGPPAWADAPTGHYASAVAGTVLDTMTGLTWQQTAPTSGGNLGSQNFAWANAKSYCKSLSLNGIGWRLPTVKELGSLVDFSKQSSPLIDLNAFPGATSDVFWSATPLANFPSMAWDVSFLNGEASYDDIVASPARVRCVR